MKKGNKMFGKKDYRDIDETDPDKYFGFVAPRTSPRTINYILKEDLERLIEGGIPTERDYGIGSGARYFKNTEGRFGGTACTAYFLGAKEIQEYVLTKPDFIQRAIKTGVTWFLPEAAQDIFVF